MNRNLLLLTILPAVAIGAIFEVFLGHRHDYAGHYLAGYGASLCAMMLAFRMMPGSLFVRRGLLGVLVMTIVCILLGALTEAFIFNLAKFDELDFCNQSIGAVLAGLVAIAFVGGEKQGSQSFDYAFVVGVVFLGAGGCYAVA